jgi:hypothetical protein
MRLCTALKKFRGIHSVTMNACPHRLVFRFGFFAALLVAPVARADEPVAAEKEAPAAAQAISAPTRDVSELSALRNEFTVQREVIRIQGYRLAQLESDRERERERGQSGAASKFIDASFIAPCFASLYSDYPLTSFDGQSSGGLSGSVGFFTLVRTSSENGPFALGFAPSLDVSVGSAVTVGGKLMAQYGDVSDGVTTRRSTRLGAELRIGRRYALARSIVFWPKIAGFIESSDGSPKANVYGGRFDTGFVFPLSDTFYAEATPSIALGAGTSRARLFADRPSETAAFVSISGRLSFGLYL